ncbi:hypothetical protein AAVH_24986 [Aphelenchoides avenae]|nr:hypothetical protein AAVH_24986 [Aphelenchus avenae]
MKFIDDVRHSTLLIMLIHHLAEAHVSYKEAKFVAAKGQLSCNGKPAGNAKVSIVAHTSRSVYTLNDALTDSIGGYSLEAAFLPTGEPVIAFKLHIRHECFDGVHSVEENRTSHRLRTRKQSANATNKMRSTHVFRELSVPTEYVYDWRMPAKVYDFSTDLAH